MNEDILFDMEQFEESVPDNMETVETDSEYGKDNVVADIDSTDTGSVVSDNDRTDSDDVESEDANALQSSEETSESVMQSIETYYSEELGGYPVVIINDLSGEYGISPVADYVDYYTTLSTTWESYFSGVLANMGDTEYLVYCLRDYVSNSYSSYVDHYVMYYDLEIKNDSLVSGSYPYMDIYRNGNDYICNSGTGSLTGVPFPAYGSFGTLSDLRKGVSHNETWAVLFAVGFAVVYCVCTRLFDNVRSFYSRS